MTEKSWKRTERSIASRLGRQRVPVSGRARGDAPTVDAGWVAVEGEVSAAVPQGLHDAPAQARCSAGLWQLPYRGPVTPVAAGGAPFDRSNLQALCHSCHRPSAASATISSSGRRAVRYSPLPRAVPRRPPAASAGPGRGPHPPPPAAPPTTLNHRHEAHRPCRKVGASPRALLVDPGRLELRLPETHPALVSNLDPRATFA